MKTTSIVFHRRFSGFPGTSQKLEEVRQMTKAAFLNAVTKSLKKGDKLTLTGFGTFSVSNRKARMGRNPQTGEAIKIKAAKVPKFSAGKGLKEAVGGKKK
jgi:DNA-binding protein HU-beta